MFPTGNATYWQAQPYYVGNYTNSSSTNAQFYYSPNAGVVFATQPGPISITWITSGHYSQSTPYTNQLATAGIPSFITNIDGTVSLLYTVNYLISPSPVKTPQNMFWTEESFQKIGHWVSVQPGQITAMNVGSTIPRFQRQFRRLMRPLTG